MTTANFTIRRATLADVADIYAVDQEAFAPYGTAEDHVVFGRRLMAYPAGFLLLVSDGETVGYACAEKWAEDREPQIGQDPFTVHHRYGRVFCITGMAVRAAHRGRGGGRALLDQLLALAQAEGCQKVVLETSHAAGFYLKRGFVVTGERQHGAALLYIMELNLEQP